jgi:hypothetical protein
MDDCSCDHPSVEATVAFQRSGKNISGQGPFLEPESDAWGTETIGVKAVTIRVSQSSNPSKFEVMFGFAILLNTRGPQVHRDAPN